MHPRRLDQWLANLGYCSRKEARNWVRSGRVKINGQIAKDINAKYLPNCVQVDDEPLDHPEGLILLVHKPLGLTCSHNPRESPLIYDLLPTRWRARNPQITSVGRLDKETSGLILLTDQTELVHRLTSPKQKIPKVYYVKTDRALSPELVVHFALGTLQLVGEKDPCAPANLKIISEHEAELTLSEGKYHQVRRMFAVFGIKVLRLHRQRFGGLDLTGVAPGKWRKLSFTDLVEAGLT